MQLDQRRSRVEVLMASVVVWVQQMAVLQIFTQLGEQRFLHYLGEDQQERDGAV